MDSMSQNQKRSDMPKARDIRDFWAPKLFSLRKILDVDQILDPWIGLNGAKIESCFCCGATGKLERAHIKALVSGGDNSVSNIHILCKKCHLDSEGLSGDNYWRWFLSCEWQDPLCHDYDNIIKSLGFSDVTEVAEHYCRESGGDTELSLDMFMNEFRKAQ